LLGKLKRFDRRPGAGARRVWIATAAAGLLALVAACGSGGSGASSSNGKVTITFAWWGDSSRAQSTIAALKLFEKAHPNVTVDTEYTPFGSYEQKISTQTAGGDLPDLITIDRGVQNEYAQRGMLLDLTPYVGKTLQLSGLNSAFVASGQTSGKQYAVPMAQNSQAIVVDQTRVQSLGLPMPQAGWTWSQWQSWAKQVTTKSHGKYYGLVDPGTLWPGFQSWEIQHGTSLYSDGKINFTVAQLTAWWTMCTQLRTSGAATNAQLTATVDGLPDDEPLLKGHAVAEWDYDSLFTMYSAGTTDKLTLVSLPTVGGKTGMFAQPSMMLGVSANSPHATEAVELLNFLINSPAAATTLGTSRGLFPNLGVRQSMASSATGAMRTVYSYESANASALTPTPPAPPKGDGQLLTLMQTMYQKVAFGQLSPAAAAQQFFSQAQGIIGQ
jgi:multiple sugar transport system substrate-binding protein